MKKTHETANPNWMKSAKRIATIYKTTNYSLFKLDGGNRDIQSSICRKVGQGLESFGGWDPCRPMVCVLDKDGKLLIRDGQNRLQEARKRQMEICFVVSPRKDITPDQYNVWQTVWKPVDYIKTYSSQGLHSYRKLKRFQRAHLLSTSSCILLLTSHGGYPRNKMLELKKGLLEISGKQWNGAKRCACFLDNVRRILRRNMNTRLVMALIKVYKLPCFNKDRFLEQLEKNPSALLMIGNSDTYVRAIEDIYNHGKRSRIQLSWLVREAGIVQLRLSKQQKKRKVA